MSSVTYLDQGVSILVTTGAHPHLPMPIDVAAATLVVGVVVFGVIAYDIYRRYWATLTTDDN